MQASRARANPIRFGAFEVDVEAGELRKNGRKVPIQELPFRVLTVLLENPGQVVTREELQQRLWAADTFVEFDQGLNTAIKKVREALSDSATAPRFVETIPKRGYRFLVPTENLGRDVPAPVRSKVGPTIWWGILIGALTGVLVVAILWKQVGRLPQALPLRKFSITPPDLATEPTADIWMPQAISPNGKYIVYVAGEASSLKRHLSLFEFERGESRPLAGTDEATNPFWSPNSDFVAFFGDACIKKVSVNGGSVSTITSTKLNNRMSGAWSPDGAELVFSDCCDLFSVPSVGGTASVLLKSDEQFRSKLPSFMPAEVGNRIIAFMHYRAGSGPAGLRLLDASNRQRSLLATDSSATYGYAWPVWSPTGHLLYQRQLSDHISEIWAVPLSLSNLNTKGSPFPIIENGGSPSVSLDGTLVYRSGGVAIQRRRLAWIDRTGKRVGEIGESQLDMYLPKLSPDGRYIAVEGYESSTAADIWLHDAVRHTKTRMTLDPARDSRPFWSPDGKQILFWSLRTGKVESFVQQADGTGTADILPGNPGLNYPTDWSQNGNYLMFDGEWDLQRQHDGTWKPIQDSVQGLAKTLSPDGRFVAFVSSYSRTGEVMVQSFPKPTHRWHVSMGDGAQPRWSRDGKELFYVNGDTLFTVPVSMRSDAFWFGTPTRLFSNSALRSTFANPTYDVAPDGRRFVLIEPVGPVPQPAIWVVQNWFAEFEHKRAGR